MVDHAPTQLSIVHLCRLVGNSRCHVTAMEFSHEEALLGVGYEDGTVRVWDLQVHNTSCALYVHVQYMQQCLATFMSMSGILLRVVYYTHAVAVISYLVTLKVECVPQIQCAVLVCPKKHLVLLKSSLEPSGQVVSLRWSSAGLVSCHANSTVSYTSTCVHKEVHGYSI